MGGALEQPHGFRSQSGQVFGVSRRGVSLLNLGRTFRDVSAGIFVLAVWGLPFAPIGLAASTDSSVLLSNNGSMMKGGSALGWLPAGGVAFSGNVSATCRFFPSFAAWITGWSLGLVPAQRTRLLLRAGFLQPWCQILEHQFIQRDEVERIAFRNGGFGGEWGVLGQDLRSERKYSLFS